MARINGGLLIVCSAVIVMGLFTGCGKKDDVSTGTTYMENVSIGPDKELTLQEQADAVEDTARYVEEYYQKLLELDKDTPDVSNKAHKKVKAITKKYADRIVELSGMDYQSMSSEELATYNEELCDIISVIREASDLITLGE